MSLKFPPYFINFEPWAKFWLSANPSEHNYFNLQSSSGLLSAVIYQYPWYFGGNFLYLSKGPVLETTASLDKADFLKELQNFFEKLLELGKKHNSVFIKVDFDHQLFTDFEVFTTLDLKNFLEQNFDLNFSLSQKTIQYMSTITLDLRDFVGVTANNDYKLFFDQTKSFWAKTNENIRRYTKKSLEQNWQISTEKTEENFELYLLIYQQTSQRQQFATQSKEYLHKLFLQDFSRIIIISDENGPQCVWLGIISEATLTYLSGGNTSVSLTKYGQYLIHLVALNLATSSKVHYYDLGGYDSGKGFGKFKEGYRGEIRNFLGPIDILIQPKKYHLVYISLGFIKKILGRND